MRNVSGEEIPARAAMEPVSRSADGYINVTKPNINDSGSALINGDHAIPVNAHGFGSYNWPIRAKYNTSETPAVNGQSIGTRAGYWELYPGYEGFLVWGRKDSGTYVVQRNVTCRTLTSGGYYYGEDPCGTRCCCWRCGANRGTNPNDTTGFTGPSTIRATVTTPCIGTPSTDSVDMVISFCGCPTLPSPCTDPPGDYYDQIAWGGTTIDTVSGGCTRCYSTPVSITWADQPRLTASLYCTYLGGSGSGARVFQFYWYHWGDVGAVQGGIILGTSGVGSRFMCNPFRCGPFQSFAFTCPATGGVNTTVCLSCVGGKSTILLEQV